MAKKQTHLAWGIVTGLVMVIFNLVIYHFGFDSIKGMAYIPYIPFAAGIILNAIAYSRANESKVTYTNVFGSCFKASAMVILLCVLYIIVCIYAFPSMKDKYMEIARASMAKNPQLTDEMMVRDLAMMSKMYVPMMIFFTGGYALVAGFLFSLIGGAVARKNPEIGAGAE